MMGGFLPDDPASILFATGRLAYRRSIDLVGATPRRPRSIVLEHTPPLVQWWSDCVANAFADAYLYELLVAGLIPEPARLFSEPAYYETWLPSRRKLYWDGRAVTGIERADGGTQPGAMVRAISDKGVCAERWCPYTGEPTENPLADDDNAGRMSMDQSGKVEVFVCDGVEAALDALAAKHRVLFAGPVFESMADVGEGGFYVPTGKRLGLHMWQMTGYEDGGDVLRMKNQWPGWGDANQEAFASRSVVEGAMMAAYAFARVARFSEVSR
jgi:hypothetical protein